jgi:ketosteroid isomerase-like protein
MLSIVPRPIDVVRKAYRAAERGDTDALIALLSPEICWIEPHGSPCPGTYVGPDEVVEALDQVDRDWRSYVACDEAYAASGGSTVLVAGTWYGTCRATGESVALPFVHVWKVRAGRIELFEERLELDDATYSSSMVASSSASSPSGTS